MPSQNYCKLYDKYDIIVKTSDTCALNCMKQQGMKVHRSAWERGGNGGGGEDIRTFPKISPLGSTAVQCV